MATAIKNSRSMRNKENLGKVVVRTRDGEAIRGFSSEKYITGEEVKMISTDGSESARATGDLKAIFFVKDFQGDSEYDEIQFFEKQPKNAWAWVRVRFYDDEVIEGRVRNSINLLHNDGFFLWPSDEEANNEVIFILKVALKDFEILAL